MNTCWRCEWSARGVSPELRRKMAECRRFKYWFRAIRWLASVLSAKLGRPGNLKRATALLDVVDELTIQTIAICQCILTRHAVMADLSQQQSMPIMSAQLNC